MATKKEKRAKALAKREEFMEKYRADGLEAQQKDHERQAAKAAKIREEVHLEVQRLRKILGIQSIAMMNEPGIREAIGK